MSFLLKFSPFKVNHFLLRLILQRQCSGLSNKINNLAKVSQLRKTKEDVASFVRFNRNINRSGVEDFSILYLKDFNPDKTEHDLEEMRLHIAQICAEYEYFSYLNMRIPSSISLDKMQILLKLSPESRQSMLVKTYFKDTFKIKRKVKNVIKRNDKIERILSSGELMSGCFSSKGKLQYGLWKNTLFTRIHSDHRIRNFITAALWGQILAFDWYFPVSLLDQDNKDPISDSLTNRFIDGRFFGALSMQILNFCVQNLTNASLCNPTLNIFHCNMDSSNIMYKYLEETSSMDKRIFSATSETYSQAFCGKKIIYISPYSEKILDEKDMSAEQDIVFTFNPYSELKQLSPSVLKQMYLMREQNESANNVHFRRLPIHEMTNKNGHIVISHYIHCLQDVLRGATWTEALKKQIPRKYHLPRLEKLDCSSTV